MPNSTPMAEFVGVGKDPLMYLEIKCVFPTPDSPRRIILYVDPRSSSLYENISN